MCGNRVEELESRVQELEASVEGLTDELVECKVRIRELESAVDEDIGFGSGSGSDGSDVTETSVGAEMVDASDAKPFGESEDEAEATKTEADNTEDNTEDSESDIIVA